MNNVMNEVKVFNLEGKEIGTMNWDATEDFRRDLIIRAFLAEQSLSFQPKGNFRWAGLLTTARYVGRKEAYHTIKNRGISRLPRQMFPKGRIGYVRIVPHAVKGRRAHPPKPEKKIVEKINKKEWKKALRSALTFSNKVIIEGLESVKKLKEMKKVLELFADFDDAKEKAKRRLKRKKGKKYKKTLLIIQGSGENIKCNLPGVDVVRGKDLRVMDVAPGGVAGRVCVFTKRGFEEVKELVK